MKTILLRGFLVCTACAATAQRNFMALDPEGVMRVMQEEVYLATTGRADANSARSFEHLF